jgi:hypothetical protein
MKVDSVEYVQFVAPVRIGKGEHATNVSSKDASITVDGGAVRVVKREVVILVPLTNVAYIRPAPAPAPAAKAEVKGDGKR